MDAVLPCGASFCRKGREMFFNAQADCSFVKFKGEVILIDSFLA
ncbi:conserved hypothetical protein [Neorickettsia risticii str. Illinois]|uniref:Uncharacterized protein n=1 Tax=Neorickettsia risticii (strain Illinois) TaxID=434131 RepID=C6V4C6_NEORI|nr:conserved hypothetical protein [Neorickettsia risticii str. Illinois]